MSKEGFPSFSGENFEKSQEQKPDLKAKQEAYQKEIFDKMDECRRLAEGIYADLRSKNTQQKSVKNKANVSPDTSRALGNKVLQTAKAKELSKKKTHNNNGFKIFIGGALVGVAGSLAITLMPKPKNDQSLNQQPVAVESEFAGDNDLSPVQVDGIKEWGETSLEHESISERSTYHGMFASEDGSTYNPEKKSDVCFGEALKSGVSESEMKEDLNSRMVQPAQLAAQYVYMSKKTTNPNFGVPGVKFDNPNDLIKAMKSDESLHQSIYDYVTNAINDGKIHEETVSGRFNNYYMTSNFETGDSDTSNVEIVGCATNEDGTKVYVLEQEWIDENGEKHTDIYLQKEDCGGQNLDQIEFTKSVSQIDESTAHHHSGGGGTETEGESESESESETDGGDPTPVPPDGGNPPNIVTPPNNTTPPDQVNPPSETHPVKNVEAEKANTGDDASIRTANPNQINSVESHASQGASNHDNVAEQAAENARKAEEAQAASEAQAAAETQATAEAEQRRQQEQAAEQQRQREEAARQAAAKAAEEEAARQAAAAAEQQRQREEAARQAAAVQAAADANAAAAAETVEPVYDANSANDFGAAAGEMGL